MEDGGPLVVSRSHGPGVLEAVDRPLDFVSALVDRLVEAGWPSAFAAAAFPVCPLILRCGDGVLDPASPQVAAVSPGGVRLVAAEMVRPGARATTAEPADADAFHDGDELRGVAHWPGVISRDSGRRPPSPARWILQVSPPRERPRPSSGRCCRGVRLYPGTRGASSRSSGVLVGRTIRYSPARKWTKAPMHWQIAARHGSDAPCAAQPMRSRAKRTAPTGRASR